MLFGYALVIWVPAAVLALWTIVFLAEPAPVTTLKHLAFDGYQTWHPRAAATSRVRVVDIDEASLQRFGQWPWPRTVLAEMVERLSAAGATVIALDLVLAEADRTSPAMMTPSDQGDLEPPLDHDRVFAETIVHSPVVTGFIMTESESGTLPPRVAAGMVALGADPFAAVDDFSGSIKTLAMIETAARGNGALNFIPGRDGVIRRVPLLLTLGGVAYPTLSVEAVRLALGQSGYRVTAGGAGTAKRFGDEEVSYLDIGDLEIVTDEEFGLWIAYSPLRQERYMPAWRLIADDQAAGELKNSIVLIGTSAAGLKDLRITALNQIVPGVEIHAQVIEQILDGTYQTRHAWNRGIEIIGLYGAAIVLVFMMAKLGAFWSAAVTTAMVAAAVTFGAYAYEAHHALFDPLNPALGLVAVFVATSIVRHIQTEQERSWIRAAFASYLSSNLVHHLINNPDALRLDGEMRDCSFVLTDLAGFTNLVDSQPPEEVVGLLNEYFAGMTDIVFRHDGTVEKIVGDSLAVMFSAPVVQDDHAERVVSCAIEIDLFCEDFATQKRAEGVAMGITRLRGAKARRGRGDGDHPHRRSFRLGHCRKYTAAADNSTIAPSATRSTPPRDWRPPTRRWERVIIISDATVRACPEFVGRPVGRLTLRGRERDSVIRRRRRRDHQTWPRDEEGKQMCPRSGKSRRRRDARE